MKKHRLTRKINADAKSFALVAGYFQRQLSTQSRSDINAIAEEFTQAGINLWPDQAWYSEHI